jgi:xylulokinase
VGPGTGEPMAVALALGLAPGRVAVSFGASTTVLAGLRSPLADPTGRVRSRADATGQHLAIATAAGGATLIEVIGELLELSPDELGALALATAPGEAAPVLVPGVPGRAGAILTGLRAGTRRPTLARAAFDGVACAALEAIDQVVDAGAAWDDDEPLRLAGPEAGLAAHAQVLATLADRVVVPAPAGSLAAAGACVQAAAVLAEADPAEVSDAWDLGNGGWVEPEEDPDRLARRLAHATERGRQRRALLDPA